MMNGNCVRCERGYHLVEYGEDIGCIKNTVKVVLPFQNVFYSQMKKEGECEENEFESDGECYPCAFNIDNCLTCTSSSCSKCKDLYTLEDGLCVLCASNSNCKECALNIENGCTSCFEHYTLDGNDKCVECGSHCSSCSSTGCIECYPGYQYSDGDCVEATTGCLLPSTKSSVCLECSSGYYLNGNDCSICSISDCLQCKVVDSTPICTNCSSGFYPNSEGTCTSYSDSCANTENGYTNVEYCPTCASSYYHSTTNECINCYSTCSACSDKDICSSCSSGYGISGTICKSLFMTYNNCKTISAVTCSVCKEGYYLSGGCVACGDNCVECNESGSCLKCADETYYINSSGICTKCTTSNCVYCSTTNECTQCQFGYFLNSEKTCTSCADGNCEKCSTINDTCISCLGGFYMDSDFHCNSCMNHCDSCNELGVCQTCETGYTFDGNSCVSKQTDDTCQTVSYLYTNGQSVSFCINCTSGYYPEANSISCTQYTAEGTEMETTYNSLQCSNTNSYIYVDTVCTAPSMPNHCTTVTTSGCNVCEDGYSLYNHYCYPDTMQGCNNDYYDNSKRSCKTCYSGYISESFGTSYYRCYEEKYFSSYCADVEVCSGSSSELASESLSNSSSESGSSSSCITLPENCYCATTDGICSLCKDGYYRNDTTGGCTQGVINNCAHIDSTSLTLKCLVCLDKYYIDGSSECSQCSSNCSYCSSGSECFECDSGYYLNSTGSCVLYSEPSNCASSDSFGNCIKCNSGHRLERDDSNNLYQCVACPSNCLTCDESRCGSCSSGFYINEAGSCISESLPNNCLTSVGSVCTSCSSGHLYDKECVICDDDYLHTNTCGSFYSPLPLCKTFSSDGTCSECFEPYYLSSGDCLPCNSSQYYSDGGCINCKSNCLYCSSSLCFKCAEGYVVSGNTCVEISYDSNCIYSINDVCVECLNTTSTIDHGCTCAVENCITCGTSKNECLQCEQGFKLSGSECKEIDGCETTLANKCIKCASGYYLSSSNTCSSGSYVINYYNNNAYSNPISCDSNSYRIVSFEDEIPELTCGNSCSVNADYLMCSCASGEYLSNNQCVSCPDSCTVCLNSSYCMQCEEGYLNNRTNCILMNVESSSKTVKHLNNKRQSFIQHKSIKSVGDASTACLRINSANGLCQECTSGYSLDINDGICLPICGENCDQCDSYGCSQCESGYLLAHVGGTAQCVSDSEKETYGISSGTSNGITRCIQGFYLKNGVCLSCHSSCSTCIDNATFCLTCPTGTMISDHECVESNSPHCKQLVYGNDICVNCDDGYYIKNNQCEACDESCATCVGTETSCITCNTTDYFLTVSYTCKELSLLTNCIESSPNSGCVECEDHFYLTKRECSECVDNCKVCSNSVSCKECYEDYVMIDDLCVHYSNRSHCLNAKNQECGECESGYHVDDSKTGCVQNRDITLFIALPLLFLFLLFVAIVIIIVAIFIIRHEKKKHEELKNVTMFKMVTSNITFVSIDESVCINNPIIDFTDGGDLLEVDKEATGLVVIGNTSNHKILVRFNPPTNDKYDIKVDPSSQNTVMVPPGFAIEFTFVVIPHCSCDIDDDLDLSIITSVDSSASQWTLPKAIHFSTKMSTRLDYEEIIYNPEDKVKKNDYSERSIGKFRGEDVSIKFLNIDDDQKLNDFQKEVELLDQFRCDYVIRFFGAVFIPGRYCLVTENATLGSLDDLITRGDFVHWRIQKMIALDIARGIEYLHNNNIRVIIHRDLKPSNVLITSLEDNEDIPHAKLTDFGHSRSVNNLMQNRTFTKNVGSPTHMAPELMAGKKCNEKIDIFSLAVIYYELGTLKPAYSDYGQHQGWMIADFISSGKRLQKPHELRDWYYELISEMWQQEPSERPNISHIIEVLETNMAKEHRIQKIN
ncbi:Protein serine/threonine kinase [Entamoeba marina]